MTERKAARHGEPHEQPTRLAATQRDAAALLDGLVGEIHERRVVLFVGSGISAGLGLPTWEDFIGRLGTEVGIAPDEFRELSSDFRSLAEFYRLEKRSLDDLCSQMAREWRVGDDELAASRAHSLIVRLGFPVVYTTNYDHLLERAYELDGKRFNKVVTARDLAHLDPALPTIVKFHGDLDDPSSLVLAETDYLRRLTFEQPLDLKLTADAFGNAVLFIGYSVSDINLRLLLFRLHGIWRASGHEDARPRSYVLMTKPNRVQERILDSWGVAPLIAAEEDENEAVSRFLAELCARCGGRPRRKNGRPRANAEAGHRAQR
jgi:hypothetical protein